MYKYNFKLMGADHEINFTFTNVETQARLEIGAELMFRGSRFRVRGFHSELRESADLDLHSLVTTAIFVDCSVYPELPKTPKQSKPGSHIVADRSGDTYNLSIQEDRQIMACRAPLVDAFSNEEMASALLWLLQK